MKRYIFLTLFCLLWLNMIAPVPLPFKYQAAAPENSGNVLSNKNVNFRISILQGYTTGISVYSELQAKTTNVFGLVDMEIGRGTSLTGDLTAINWGSNTFFSKVESDFMCWEVRKLIT